MGRRSRFYLVMRSRLSSQGAIAFAVSVDAIASIFPNVRSRFQCQWMRSRLSFPSAITLSREFNCH